MKFFLMILKSESQITFLDAAGINAATTIGNTISKVDAILEEIKPDALLVLGDTNSCLSVIPAKRRQIPIFHMEAGNRCFDHRVPEETNRRIVDHVSDINLTYSNIAREYLLREGFPPDQIIKTGSPMFEVLCHYEDKINRSNCLVNLNLDKHDYFVLSAHREENIEDDKSFDLLIKSMEQISKKYDKKIIVSTHPRTRKKIEEMKINFSKNINLLKPMGFCDYVKLQKNAFVVLSDSGTITEESSILNFPALNIRETHERPEGMEESSVIMVGLDVDCIIQGIEQVEKQERGEIDQSFQLVIT